MGEITLDQEDFDRTFVLLKDGKQYVVNYIFSTGQTLKLMNRSYWEVWNEDQEELGTEKGEEELAEELIGFCKKRLMALGFVPEEHYKE